MVLRMQCITLLLSVALVVWMQVCIIFNSKSIGRCLRLAGQNSDQLVFVYFPDF